MRIARPRHLAWTLIAAVAACGGDDPNDPGTTAARGTPVVCTTFYPTTYMARRIAGDRADVVCPVPADADPIFWKPTREAVARYQKADLIIVNGAEFEKWVATASLPQSRVVDTAHSFRDKWIEFKSASAHKHGPAGEEHSHAGIDGHTWLDPQLATIQARAIRDGLIRLVPDAEAEFRRRCDALAQDLDALHEELLALNVAEPLFTNHPAYNYLARRYGWTVVNFDLDGEFPPTDAQLEEIKAKKKEHPGARIMLWEGAPEEAVAKAVADATGLKSIEFSPCEGPPDDDGDYVVAMRVNIDRLRKSLGG